MADSHVIYALARKRAELSGEIGNTHFALKRMIQELEHLDKTLLMSIPTIRWTQSGPKLPPEDWSKCYLIPS